jgi:hypothetical protein
MGADGSMNQWHLGNIEGYPVEVFLSDDYSLDTYLDEGGFSYPMHIIEVCERIREQSLLVRSQSGAEKVLRDNGWSNI